MCLSKFYRFTSFTLATSIKDKPQKFNETVTRKIYSVQHPSSTFVFKCYSAKMIRKENQEVWTVPKIFSGHYRWCPQIKQGQNFKCTIKDTVFLCSLYLFKLIAFLWRPLEISTFKMNFFIVGSRKIVADV